MAPSRGPSTTSPQSPSSTSTLSPTQPQTSTETKAALKESTALTSLRRNLIYLYDPTRAHSTSQTPTRLRTRALLRSAHYIGVFLFWRLVRWAKYLAVGYAVAAVGGLAFAGSLASVASGIGFLIAPTGILASIAVGAVWGVGRLGWRVIWRRAHGRFGKGNEVSEGGGRSVGGAGSGRGVVERRTAGGRILT